jgi:glycosyltransferase involved in cell wall biosynthesis
MSTEPTGNRTPPPLVSIVIPSFNQGRFIRDTITSTIAQSYRPLEILVMDGASSDDTVAVLKSFQDRPELRWWSEPDEGVVDAVNKGLSRARGEIAGIQSSDDSYLPDAISTAVGVFDLDPKVGVVYGDVRKTDEQGRELMTTRLPAFSLVSFLSKTTWIPQCSAFFRLKLATEFGGWDKAYFNADTEFWLRLAFRTEIRKVDAVLGVRRQHGTQRDQQGDAIRESYARMIADSPDLARASWKVRRAATGGRFMHALRYGAAHSDLAAAFLLWRAIAAYPPLLGHLPDRAALVPGYYGLRRALRRLLKAPTPPLEP